MKTVKLTKAQVSTAIFEYLNRRGKTPNRKRGVTTKVWDDHTFESYKNNEIDFYVKVK